MTLVWKPGLILQSPTANDPLLDLNTQPSLDLQFATSKTLNDRVSGQNLITFSRSTTGTYVDSNGIIQTAAIDAPRFDHDPTTGESLGLLIEESRTNLLLNSETLVTQSVTVTAIAHTLSFYGNGTVTLSGTHSATVVGTGGYPTRTTLTFTPTAGSLTVTVSGTVQYAQLEAGAFPTSYIPTSGSTVPRAADVASITGSNFSRWYNQSEGTVSLSANHKGSSYFNNAIFVKFNNNSTDNQIKVFSVATDPYLYITDSASAQAYIDGGSVTVGTPNKYAAGFALNNFALSVNGSTAVTDISGTNPSGITQLTIGSKLSGVGQPNGHISRLTYYPYRLPDATLQEITS